MIKNIKFMITDKQYIQVMPESVENSSCGICAECNISFIDENTGLKIKFGQTELETFHGIFGFREFDNLIKNRLFFDNKERIDPGFEYNQYCQDFIENSDVIDKYFFESNSHTDTPPYYTSWFYNDKDGNIIFEISPYYHWSKIEDAENQPGYVTYEDFIKNYKVVIRKTIPRETLIQWNEQAKSYHPVS